PRYSCVFPPLPMPPPSSLLPRPSPPPPLPPSPTRRSSDLPLAPGVGQRHHVIDLDRPTGLRTALEVDDVSGVGVRQSSRQHHARDRKSTRLNSSHVSISYAVFCLKKKTTPSRPNDKRTERL